jgi:hypothetical protein
MDPKDKPLVDEETGLPAVYGAAEGDFESGAFEAAAFETGTGTEAPLPFDFFVG